MPLPAGTLRMKDCRPGSCVPGSIVRPAMLDMVIGSAGTRRHRIKSAVRQLSFQSGGEDADAMLAAREAVCVQRSADAQEVAARGSDAQGRPRLESVQSAGFSPHSQRLWSFDRATEIELVAELFVQLVCFDQRSPTDAYRTEAVACRRRSSWVCRRFNKHA